MFSGSLNLFEGGIGENLLVPSGVTKLFGEICLRLGTVEQLHEALHIDAVADRPVCLCLHPVPQFALPGKNQGEGILGIHPVVQKEPDFFQHLPVQQMGFIHDDNELFLVQSPHHLDLPVQQLSGVSPVEPPLGPHLLEEVVVKVSRRELGFRDVEKGSGSTLSLAQVLSK